MQRFAIVAIFAALLVAGCQTRPPYAQVPPAPATPAQPAPAPAPHPPSNQAVLGGPVGVVASAETGSYMDAQESLLRRRLRASGVRVARLGDDIVLMLQSEILFGSGSASLSPRAQRTLDEIAQTLRQYDKTLIEVNGYTDTTGSADTNLRLSQRRAESVADVFVADGVNAARISPRGFGETHPAVPTGDNVNEPRNRRVEIRIVPHIGKG